MSAESFLFSSVGDFRLLIKVIILVPMLARATFVLDCSVISLGVGSLMIFSDC